MLTNTIMTVAGRSPKTRKRIFRWTFETLAAMTRNVDDWTFMNYGYAVPDDEPAMRPYLAAADEAERYCAQLYDAAVAPIDLGGKDVVEISCGRGGGASYVKRYLGARSVTGVDLSANQIEFCRRVHQVSGLRFVQGDAEDVPLPDGCADAVINVEASCLYQDTARFFREVFRLLRPGGCFVYADIHLVADVDGIDAQLARSGLETHAYRDITRNVVQALALDNERRLAGLRRHAPFFLRGLLKSFAGTQGTRIPTSLIDGGMVYLSLVLTKPAASAMSDQRTPREERQCVPVSA